MNAATRALVRQRAGDRCEYCLIRQEHAETTHHIEHIIARQHGGSDDPSNLALACIHCNSHKGPNLTGIDPASGELVPLFHPRREVWEDHFAIHAALIVGSTPNGRSTVHVLAMNLGYRLHVRAELVALGLFA
ncbi:hypothetical protein BH23PLA1_BH23PLA1_10610 [soil metagenome]